MKSIFRTLISLAMINVTIAQDIIVLTHNDDLERVNLIKEIIINKHHIPASFIQIIKTELPCKTRKGNVLHLCFENREMKLMHIEKDVVTRTFKTFMPI